MANLWYTILFLEDVFEISMEMGEKLIIKIFFQKKLEVFQFFLLRVRSEV